MSFSGRFLDAFQLAAKLHKNQKRKGSNTPYISHLMAVSAIVMENGGSEDEAIAALLHDAVEDQGGTSTLELIRREFGDKVAHIVAGCSDTDKIFKPPWRKRKEAYLEHLLTASPSIRLVSSADKLHNARSILSDYYVLGEKLWRRFYGGKEGTLWYYRSLVQTLHSCGTTPLVEELDRVVTALEHVVKKNE